MFCIVLKSYDFLFDFTYEKRPFFKNLDWATTKSHFSELAPYKSLFVTPIATKWGVSTQVSRHGAILGHPSIQSLLYENNVFLLDRRLKDAE